MRQFNLMVTIAVATLLGLAMLGGCSEQQAPKTSLADSTANLLVVAQTIKTDLSVGNSAKVKEQGPRLEKVWSGFEDDVKAHYPDFYEKVETYLDPTLAAIKDDHVDAKIINQLIGQLITTLEELKSEISAESTN